VQQIGIALDTKRQTDVAEILTDGVYNRWRRQQAGRRRGSRLPCGSSRRARLQFVPEPFEQPCGSNILIDEGLRRAEARRSDAVRKNFGAGKSKLLLE
jgi:hypothetical protein